MCIEATINQKNSFKPIETPDGTIALALGGTGSASPSFPRSPHQDGDDSDSSSYKPSQTPSPESGRRVSPRRKIASKPKHAHIVTQHNYHDHAADPVDHELVETKNDNHVHKQHNPNMMSFPLKLYDMLESVEATGGQDVVSWQSHGRCFVVHDVARFKETLPGFFKLSKIASFQRQLNLYGFQRLTVGPDKGGYYHELFLRGRLDLVAMIQRVKVKGTGVRAKANPEEEPNLYLYPAVDTETARVVAMATPSSDPQKITSAPVMPLSNLMLCSTMMMVPRDYDKVQDALEQDADRLLAIQKPVLPVRNQGLIDQVTSDMLPNESGHDRRPADINFDRLIDEMFSHNQSLDFADLLKLAAV